MLPQRAVGAAVSTLNYSARRNQGNM